MADLSYNGLDARLDEFRRHQEGLADRADSEERRLRADAMRADLPKAVAARLLGDADDHARRAALHRSRAEILKAGRLALRPQDANDPAYMGLAYPAVAAAQAQNRLSSGDDGP